MNVTQKLSAPSTNVRWNDAERALIQLLLDKTGISNINDLLRVSLRALATKEGVSI